MKKRLYSMILAMAMLFSMLPAAAFAAGGDYEVNIVASKFSTVQYNGKDTMKLDFMLQTNNSVQVTGIQTALLSFDLEKYDVLQYVNNNVYDRTSTVSTGSAEQKAYAYTTYYDAENDIGVTAKTTFQSSDTNMLMSFEADFAANTLNLSESTSMMSVLLGLKDGVEWTDLTADSIRLATATEASNFNATGVVTINEVNGNSSVAYVYLPASGEESTLTITPTFAADNSFTFAGSSSGGEDGSDSEDPTFTFYYVNSGTDSDDDGFYEVNPGATVSFDVYVKADSEKVMQAFDIYPVWNSMLSSATVTAANGITIDTDEMSATNPHFYSVASNLNLTVPTTGVKIATLTLTLSSNAVYNMQYPVYFADATNSARALNAESVDISVDTTGTIGAETLKKVAVNFDTNGGSAVDAQSIGYNTTATQPDNPTKNGYTFDGWYAEAALTNVFDFDTAIKTDTTIYAKWNADSVTVTLNANGGTFGTESTKTVEETFNGTYANALKDENKPTYDGYTFAGWSLTNTGTNDELIDANTTVSNASAHTLYAQWTPITYTVKFDGNEADSGSVADVTVAYNVEFTMPENGFARTGWKFNGWNTMKDGTGTSYTAGTNYKELTSESEITLYAQWTQANYDIDVAADIKNGKVELDKEAANYEETVTVTVTPNAGYKIGDVFYYLTADADDEDKTTTTITVADDGKGTFSMPAGNVTVSATFEAIDLTVEVGTVTNGTVNIEAGETDVTKKTDAHVGEPITLNVVPTTPGYKVKENSVTYTYTEGTETKSGTATKGEDGQYTFTMPAYDVTVNAEFEPISYTIAFNGNSATTGSMESITGVKYDADQKLTKNAFTKNGYNFAGWLYNGTTYTDEDTVKNLTSADGETVTLVAQWTEATYTITFVTNGGTITADGVTEVEAGETYTMKYTYGAEANLPEVTKALQTIENWIVSYVEDTKEYGKNGWGAAGATIGDKASIKTYFGDVTLTADWEETFVYAVEDYKYAPADYVMLRIAAGAATEANSNAYTFNSGAMYYTEDTNYLLGDKAVFVTLIPKTLNEVSMVTTGTNGYELTAEGLDMISQTNEAAVEIARDGKINKDDVVNIADANAVYQMLTQGSRGGYYGWDQLDILSRLEADMDTAAESGEYTAEHRGSIVDVHKIVDKINENANKTTG